MREKYDFMNLPLLVRPNTVLPVNSRTDRPDYDYSDDVTLKVFQLENGRSIRVEIPTLAGNVETIFDVQREDDVIRIQRQGPPKAWKVLLVNVHLIESNEAVEKTSEGMLILPKLSANSVEIKVLPQ